MAQAEATVSDVTHWHRRRDIQVLVDALTLAAMHDCKLDFMPVTA
jgi:hypothetical protein